MGQISVSNIGERAPKWYRKLKGAILTLTVAANAMIASWGFTDELMTMRLQLWCTIGIVALLEAFGILLKEDPDDTGA